MSKKEVAKPDHLADLKSEKKPQTNHAELLREKIQDRRQRSIGAPRTEDNSDRYDDKTDNASD